jgi:hypothetical protein
MNDHIEFLFRDKQYTCEVYIDNSEVPCIIYSRLEDKDLIDEFGEDIVVKTDLVKRLPKKDDYPQLVILRQALFDVVKTSGEFKNAKKKYGLIDHPL